MPTNEEIVREACHVIWTEGQTDKVADYYAEDFQADYPMTNWGEGLEGVRNLQHSSLRLYLSGLL